MGGQKYLVALFREEKENTIRCNLQDYMQRKVGSTAVEKLSSSRSADFLFVSIVPFFLSSDKIRVVVAPYIISFVLPCHVELQNVYVYSVYFTL